MIRSIVLVFYNSLLPLGALWQKLIFKIKPVKVYFNILKPQTIISIVLHYFQTGILVMDESLLKESPENNVLPKKQIYSRMER